MIQEIVTALQQATESSANEQSLLSMGQMLADLSQSETIAFFEQLVEFSQSNADSWIRPTTLLLANLPNPKIADWLPDETLAPIRKLYEICPADEILRIQLLAMLANKGSESAIDLWCDLLCECPPESPSGIEAAFSPLITNAKLGISRTQLARLIEKGTDHPVAASALYELANHQYRQGNVDPHPLADRAPALVELLGALIQRMAVIEEGGFPEGTDPDTIAATVQNSVALIIALIDTLGLLKVEAAASKFNQAMDLRHRRIQVEAAAALTTLDEPGGKQKLLDLLIHPVVRPRILSYAKELGFEKEISLEHKGPIANAETQLALWLAQAQQMGLAPTAMNLLDQRELYWPSYEDPLACYLFSFEYGTGDNAYRNVGISGPLTHAFVSDISDLSIADQYSAFAGWQTVTDEIYAVPIERATNLLAGPTESLKRRIEMADFDEFEIDFVACFFGEYVMAVSGKRANKSGTMIIDQDEQYWIPSGNPKSPIDTKLAFDIWSGRKLLTSFNPAFS